MLTAADLIPLNLHYMPTLAGDVQAVLAHEKVLFQNQEVAFVIATDRYIAADAVELVEVDYEELPPLVDPFKAMLPDAPLLREDIKDKTDGAHGPRKHHNHIFTWGSATRPATDAAFAGAPVTVKELISYQRCHPCPIETCACVASMRQGPGRADAVGHLPGAACGAHRGLADRGDLRSTRSASSRPTSAAASATRSASIPAM